MEEVKEKKPSNAGRKPKAKEDKRSERITFLATPAFLEKIKADKDRKDAKDLSSYIEAAIKEYMKKTED